MLSQRASTVLPGWQHHGRGGGLPGAPAAVLRGEERGVGTHRSPGAGKDAGNDQPGTLWCKMTESATFRSAASMPRQVTSGDCVSSAGEPSSPWASRNGGEARTPAAAYF